VEARIVQAKQGWVQLEKPDGRRISLPVSKLSEADQEYLRQRE